MLYWDWKGWRLEALRYIFSYLNEVSVEAKIVPNGVLPALVRRPVVRVILRYVAINAGQCELLVRCARYRLHYQLCVRVGRLCVILTAARYITVVHYRRRYLHKNKEKPRLLKNYVVQKLRLYISTLTKVSLNLSAKKQILI